MLFVELNLQNNYNIGGSVQMMEHIECFALLPFQASNIRLHVGLVWHLVSCYKIYLLPYGGYFAVLPLQAREWIGRRGRITVRTVGTL